MVRVMNIAFKEGLTIRYISLPWSHPESEQRVSLPFTLTPESHSSTICVRFLILFVPILELIWLTNRKAKQKTKTEKQNQTQLFT